MGLFNNNNEYAVNNDDIRVIRSYIEYAKDGKTLKHMVYELETLDSNGTMIHLYKVIKFVRIIRLPKDAKQSTSFMEMHTQVLASIWQQNINLITIIANMITPPLGLLFLYGIQGCAATLETAERIAEQDYEGLVGMLQGTYRTLEFRPTTNEESEWLREKMYSMKCMTTLRGIPIPKDGGVDAGNKGMGGNNLNPDSQATTEEFILGLSDKEYVVEILSTPVSSKALRRWLTQTAKEMTRWNGQLSGTKSMNFGISIPMMYMANLGASESWSHSYSDATSEGVSQGISNSVSNSTSLSESFSTSESQSQSTSQSVSSGTSESWGTSEGTSHSTGVSHSVSDGTSSSTSHSYGVSQSTGTSSSTSTGTSNSISNGISNSTSESTSSGISNSSSFGTSNGISNSTGTSNSVSESMGSSSSNSYSQGTSNSNSTSYGESASNSYGQSSNTSAGYNQSNSNSWSYGQSAGNSSSTSNSFGGSSSQGQSGSWSQGGGTNSGWNHSNSASQTSGNTMGVTFGPNIGNSSSNSTTASNGSSGGVSSSWSNGGGFSSSNGTSWSNGTSNGVSSSTSASQGGGTSYGTSMSQGYGENWGISNGTSASWGQSSGTSESYGVSNGNSYSTGTSMGTSTSQGTSASSSESYSSGTSNSTSMGTSSGTSSSTSQGTSASTSQGVSTSHGTSESWGTSYGTSHSESHGTSESWGTSSSTSHSTGTSNSVSSGTSQGTSTGTSHGTSTGTSQGTSSGTSSSTSKSTSKGTSTGTSGGISSGSSATMGASPSFSLGKSFQWLDQEVQNILELLEFQNMRLMKALNGYGAFFTDVFIATPDENTKKRANSLAKSAWFNGNAKICPLQVMELAEEEQAHLLYHFNCFSPDVTMDTIPGSMRSYRYSTILLSDEYTSYTHLPRVSEGGIFADVNDIPKFAVPSMKKGEIYMGKILSGERYTQTWGYKTPFDYRLAENEIMHGFFTGESRSGKTVAATRFIAELATNVKRKTTGKRMRIVCLDPKQDWRILAKFVEPERFKFFSLGNPEFLPINLNICKIPHNVYPQQWVDGLIEIYCRAYGLGERGKSVLSETFFKLYEEAGVFVPEWREVAPERSATVTMVKIYKTMLQFKLDLEDPAKSGKGRVGNDVRDAYSRVLDRMQVFGRPFSIEAQLFGRDDGMGIDELIGADDVVVLESYGLESTFKNFIFGTITSAFFKYAQAHEGGFKAADQYETILVIEEANEVLVGQDSADNGGGSPLSGQSEFEKILDQSAGLGLFIISITQKIAAMPTSVIANSGLVFAGKISREDDVKTVVRKIGREERYEDRDLVKWFPRSPIGWFVCRSSRNFDFKETEPSLVAIEPLSVDPPTNAELEHMVLLQKTIEKLNASDELSKDEEKLLEESNNEINQPFKVDLGDNSKGEININNTNIVTHNNMSGNIDNYQGVSMVMPFQPTQVDAPTPMMNSMYDLKQYYNQSHNSQTPAQMSTQQSRFYQAMMQQNQNNMVMQSQMQQNNNLMMQNQMQQMNTPAKLPMSFNGFEY